MALLQLTEMSQKSYMPRKVRIVKCKVRTQNALEGLLVLNHENQQWRHSLCIPNSVTDKLPASTLQAWSGKSEAGWGQATCTLIRSALLKGAGFMGIFNLSSVVSTVKTGLLKVQIHMWLLWHIAGATKIIFLLQLNQQCVQEGGD